MDFTLSPNALLKQHFKLNGLTGTEKFLILSSILVKGQVKAELTTGQVKKYWSKTVLAIVFSSTYYHRAQLEGWVVPTDRGTFLITERGYAYLETLVVHTAASSKAEPVTNLEIFLPGKTHDFDKFLRELLSSSLKEIRIADSYVDGTIFDNLLDQIPERVKIHLLYGKKQELFDARIKRFEVQYSNFKAKQYPALHDRFLIIDSVGYIIGPSLKDAAKKSPALVIELGKNDVKNLKNFFDELWRQAK